MRVSLMIEGQEGVTWDQWRALATTAEAAGFEALLRSDHYMGLGGQGGWGSLDAWTTLGAMAAVTSRIRLGTLVSPATFRHPSVLAKAAATVDQISGGRVEVGLGAGWHQREHAAHGFPFPPTRERFDVLAEQLEIVRRSWEPEPFTFEGRHYALTDADPHPKPVQARVPLIMGGNARPRASALAARWADEYNTIYATPDECRERRANIAAACEEAGREPLPFSLMTGVLVGADRAELEARARRQAPSDAFISGTPDEAIARLKLFEEAGVERIMLQHLLHDDLEMVELIGREIIPAVA
jgi:F420-dependent oxidoreductase-like protein